MRQLWKKTGWKNEDVDLYEINEAFSVAAIAVTRELGLDLNKVNVNGGAVALGHPIGASGARILTTLLYEMIRRDVHKGIAALCLGGGNAVGSGGRAVIARVTCGFTNRYRMRGANMLPFSYEQREGCGDAPQASCVASNEATMSSSPGFQVCSGGAHGERLAPLSDGREPHPRGRRHFAHH